jgi:flagellar FliL protein
MATTNETQPELDQGSADGAGAAPAVAKRKLPLKLIIMVAAGLAGVAAVGGGIYAIFGGHGSAAASTGQIKPPVFVDMPDVLVNLSSSGAGDRTQYLKVKVVLELPDQAMMAQIQPIMPRLTDTFQTYLRELRPTDLDGSAGLYRLKEELTRRVNAAIAPNRINAVLFKEIVVQ